MTEDKIKLAIERGMTYDPITGNIYGSSGKLITSKCKKGYIYPGVWFENKTYRFFAHIFAWYVTYSKMPDNQIDHINGVRDDNRIINLRDVTNQQNQQNQTKAKGYYWVEHMKKWRAMIGVDEKRIHLGYFDTEEEARQAYLDAKKIYHIIEYDL
jgi:hypothetical protein